MARFVAEDLNTVFLSSVDSILLLTSEKSSPLPNVSSTTGGTYPVGWSVFVPRSWGVSPGRVEYIYRIYSVWWVVQVWRSQTNTDLILIVDFPLRACCRIDQKTALMVVEKMIYFYFWSASCWSYMWLHFPFVWTRGWLEELGVTFSSPQ